MRALDAGTGSALWSDLVEAPAVAKPAIYTLGTLSIGYVAFVAGGNSILKPEVSNQLVPTGSGTELRLPLGLAASASQMDRHDSSGDQPKYRTTGRGP